MFFRLCIMFAQGRQSHVSSVDAVTLRHAQPKLKHLVMHWANQTASDGIRQAHGMPPIERTQLSREQSECLFGQRAGILVSGAGTPNTKKKLVVQSVEALHFGHVCFKTQTSMVSLEDPCEAEEHAVEEHDLQEQPKKTAILTF
jgi:hypothetical protein